MRVQKCKGTCDLSAEDMKRFRFIEGVFRDSCLKWGHKEIRTPVIEYLHLFTSAGTLTAGTLSKVYSFLDWDGWSGERVVLRPEGTIPAVRYYIDSLADKKIARLFYVINTFVFEETGRENREKWQCGVELIGAGSTMADVELITLSLEILRELELRNVTLKLSHAGIIRALLARFGLSTQEQSKVFDRILDGDTAVLIDLKQQSPELVRLMTPLLDLSGSSPEFLRNLKAMSKVNLPELIPALDNFISVAEQLTAMGQKYEIELASGRGFEYYTGIIFQLFSGETKLGGGGRYDALIPLMGGKNTPASGFALQMNTLMELVNMSAKVSENKILVDVKNSQNESVSLTYDLASNLRKGGYAVTVQLGGEDKTDFRWIVNVKEKGYILTDQSSKSEVNIKSTKELLKLLGGKGGS